jgi:membrane fusion protein, multidrug efflux system
MKVFFTRKVLLICGVFFLCSCGKEESEKKPSPPFVSISKVEKRDLPISVNAIGHLVPFNTVNIQAQVEGELVKVEYKEGQDVTKGQLLLEIDSKIYKANLDIQKAALDEDIANLEYAKEQVKSYSNLVKDEFVAKLEYKNYQMQQKSLQAKVEMDQAKIEQAKVTYEYCFIYSPIDGRVGKRLVDIGNIVEKKGKSLLVINQLDPIYVDFSISERTYYEMQKRQKEAALKVEVYPVGDHSKVFLGTLQMYDNQVQLGTGMLGLRAVLDNKDEVLWPGQFCKVKLILYTESDALLVPDIAVSVGQKGHYIFVIDSDNTAEFRVVEIGEHFGDMVQITKGLKGDERVVTNGQLRVRPGVKVQIKTTK